MLHPRAETKDGITVVFKNPAVAEGLSDLPWHRDCGMGGHASMCPTYVLSLYLYDATAAQGALQFLPGSHRYAFGFADAGQTRFAGAVTVPAKAGDITLHIGDVMHAAPPPESETGPFRQSILLAFHPDFTHHRGERHYNDALLGTEDGQVPHLKQLVEDPPPV
jgi:ectoine hydroxylase-related dioxygenase (phytanoyl-CoA dioxygenase family)